MEAEEVNLGTYYGNMFDDAAAAMEAVDDGWYLDTVYNDRLPKNTATDVHRSDPTTDRWVLNTEGDEYLNLNQRPLVRHVEDAEDPWATRWVLDTRGDEILSGLNARTSKHAPRGWAFDTTGDEYLGQWPIVRPAESDDDRWATRWILRDTEEDEIIPKDIAKLRSMTIRNCIR
ncbi:hypothetical protein WOLCODRAFT_137862, partial [Wolfiporia cocos MD-104 SS10]